MTWCRESPGICCKRAHQSQLLEGKEDLGYLFSESESHSVMSDSLQPHGLYSPWTSLGQNIGVGSLSLLLGIFPTQRSNPGLPHCRWILYQLSHKGSPPAYSNSMQFSWGLVECPVPSTLLGTGMERFQWDVMCEQPWALLLEFSQPRVGFQLKGTQSVLLRLALVITLCPLPSSSNLFQLRPPPLWGSCSVFQ